MEPSLDKVADLQPICPEVSPSHLARCRLPALTLAYLRHFCLVDQRLLSLCPRGVMVANGPYQAYLCLRWDRILSSYPVAVVTMEEVISDINDDAVHGDGDPDFDPFNLFLVNGYRDY